MKPIKGISKGSKLYGKKEQIFLSQEGVFSVFNFLVQPGISDLSLDRFIKNCSVEIWSEIKVPNLMSFNDV